MAACVPTVRIWLSSDGERVLVQVWNASDGLLVLRDPHPDVPGGRGLVLVDALSEG